MVHFAYLRVKELIYGLDILVEMQFSEVNCVEEYLLIGGRQLNGLRGMNSPICRHPPTLALQEQFALKGLNISFAELLFFGVWYLFPESEFFS